MSFSKSYMYMPDRIGQCLSIIASNYRSLECHQMSEQYLNSPFLEFKLLFFFFLCRETVGFYLFRNNCVKFLLNHNLSKTRFNKGRKTILNGMKLFVCLT